MITYGTWFVMIGVIEMITVYPTLILKELGKPIAVIVIPDSHNIHDIPTCRLFC